MACGNYSVFKRFDILASAIKRINEQGHRLTLLIIGEDKSQDKAQWEAVVSKRDQHTYQIGLKENVADYMYCSDALVMSSSKEGMPLVILEAMSMGKPIVSTPAGGIVDMVKNGINGLVANGFNEDDVIELLNKFLKMPPNARDSISKKNIEDFKNKFSMAVCADRYLNLYLS